MNEVESGLREGHTDGLEVSAGFCGTYHHRVDPKGRVAVPAHHRRLLSEGGVVAPGPEQRLMIWPPDQWCIQLEQFRRTAETPAQERRFIRVLVGNSYPLDVDAQGRLLLTAAQREWAGIDDAAVFTGLGDGVEITSERRWIDEQGDLAPDEFTRLHDLVHQRGYAAPPSPA